MQTSNGLGVSDGQTINPAALSSCTFYLSSPIIPSAREKFIGRDAIPISRSCNANLSLSQSVLTSNLTALANQTITPETSPRGVKRSRSPDPYSDLAHGEHLGDDGM
jgi:hypothetical protein